MYEKGPGFIDMYNGVDWPEIHTFPAQFLH